MNLIKRLMDSPAVKNEIAKFKMVEQAMDDVPGLGRDRLYRWILASEGIDLLES